MRTLYIGPLNERIRQNISLMIKSLQQWWFDDMLGLKFVYLWCFYDKKIMIISIFKEDNILSITAFLPYGPPVNTDIDYYQTFSDVFVIVAKLGVRFLI